jgi:hypothetical protein
MARFIYIFVMIFCSVHARAQYREHEEDREDALQGVEKVLAVKAAERVAANGGAVPPFMPNDNILLKTLFLLNFLIKPQIIFYTLLVFSFLRNNRWIRKSFSTGRSKN